ncbi:hypothetical protein MKX01_021694 [Papaver californicum]|nr:hypothetical protein MKX01_021694 [Papaver californicum]
MFVNSLYQEMMGLNSGIGSIATPHQDHLHPGNLVGNDNGKPDGTTNSHHFM